MGPEAILTFAQASTLSGIPAASIRRLARLGVIPSVFVAGTRRVRLSAVLQVLAEAPAA
jgi:hypothetical protein